MTQANIGAVYHKQDDHDSALAAWHEARVIFESVNSPNAAGVLCNIAFLHQSQGQPDLEAECYEQAAAIYARSHGKKHPNTAMARKAMVRAERQKGPSLQTMGYAWKSDACIAPHPAGTLAMFWKNHAKWGDFALCDACVKAGKTADNCEAFTVVHPSQLGSLLHSWAQIKSKHQ